MNKLLVRFGILASVIAVVMIGCGENSNSPSQPDPLQAVRLQAQSDCGEVTYLSQLSPVLPVWEDSIETWLTAPGLLDAPPTWTEASTVDGYLGTLVPVLQQWEVAINDSLASAVLDTVANFDPATTPRQEYLTGLSSLLVGWEQALETARGVAFLPAPPIFVPDETPPEITCGATDTTITCVVGDSLVFAFDAVATDDCDPSPEVTCEPPSGSAFPIGATVVTCTAVDSVGNTSTCSFTVTVEAAPPPVIVDVTASPNVLWPPNHKWVDIAISTELENPCELPVSCTIVDVTSNESANGRGDGNTEPDWMVAGDGTLKLRAERSGNGGGRVYTVRVRCETEAGEGSEATVEVVVPHDQGGHAAGR
jgi:hypothetical protein